MLQSELVANEQLPPASDDPRVAAALSDPLVSELFQTDDAATTLVHRTRRSGLRMAAAMAHEVDGPGKVRGALRPRPRTSAGPR